MTTETKTHSTGSGHALDPAIEARVEELVAKKFNELLQGQLADLTRQRVQQEPSGGKPPQKRLAIIASKGTLDMAYPPLILATTAAALGWEVGVFFTFYGLDILNRRKVGGLKVPPLANPAMPVPVPNFIGALPGMTAVATVMMKSWMGRANMPSIQELLEVAKESDVKLYACTTTMAVMKVKRDDIIQGVELAGAAAFLDFASESQVSLFI